MVLVSLLLTMNKFHTLLCCFHGWFWTSKCQLGRAQIPVHSQQSSNWNIIHGRFASLLIVQFEQLFVYWGIAITWLHQNCPYSIWILSFLWSHKYDEFALSILLIFSKSLFPALALVGPWICLSVWNMVF